MLFFYHRAPQLNISVQWKNPWFYPPYPHTIFLIRISCKKWCNLFFLYIPSFKFFLFLIFITQKKKKKSLKYFLLWEKVLTFIFDIKQSKWKKPIYLFKYHKINNFYVLLIYFLIQFFSISQLNNIKEIIIAYQIYILPFCHRNYNYWNGSLSRILKTNRSKIQYYV